MESHASPYLTVQETADFLRVPKSWVYERTRMGGIPVRKIGRHVRIPRDELVDWVNCQNQPTGSLPAL